MLVDEFRTQQGSVELEVAPYANSWRVSPQCPQVARFQQNHECSNEDRLAWSRQSCHL